MHMLGTVLSQLRQKVGTWMDQCRVKVSQTMLLCRTIIAVGIDQMTLIAQYTKSKLVALKWNIEHLVARLIIAVRLTKVELMIAILNLGVRGHQALTIVRQIPQRVLSLLKRGK